MKGIVTIGVVDPPSAPMLGQLADKVGAHIRVIDCSCEVERNSHLSEINGLVTESWFPQPDKCPNLRWIHVLSSGYEHMPSSIRASKQWQVTHSGGTGAVPMAEWCLSMMLYFGHRLGDILAYQALRKWHVNRTHEFSATPLHGARLGILGYGAIGRELARITKPLGMVVYATVSRSGDKSQKLSYLTQGTGDPEGIYPDRWFRLDELPSNLEQFDYVVLALRSSSYTTPIVDRRFLAQMKRSAVLVNFARGALVDETALLDALYTKQIRGAALDVFQHEPLPVDDPLRGAPRLIISPHCSPESVFYRNELVNCTCANILRFATQQPLLNCIE